MDIVPAAAPATRRDVVKAMVGLTLTLGGAAASPAQADDSGRDSATAESFPVTITVDAGKTVGPMKPIWRFFGADEPNYAYMKNGKKLLAELGQLAPKEVFFRTHNLLTSGDGTPALKWGSTGVYDEDAAGNPIYNWTILDRIFE